MVSDERSQPFNSKVSKDQTRFVKEKSVSEVISSLKLSVRKKIIFQIALKN